MINSQFVVLDLREFDSFPARKRLEGDPAEFVLDVDGADGVEKVSADLAIQKSGEEYYCQGDVDATVRLECARCLKLFDGHFRGHTDFVVCSQEHHAAQRELALDDEEYVCFQGDDLCVDLTEVIRQTIVLGISMMPLCSEDCRGLCVGCGKNLNEGDCTCRDDDIDSRWEGLQGLSGR